jgi:membrane-bound lytic murein transglycosylase A
VPVCARAALVQPGFAAAFFQSEFDWVRVGDGKAFATGYYEPEIAASPVPAPGYSVPVYSTPPDLTRCQLPDGRTGRGRIDETGACVYYFTRAEIEDGALAGKGLEIAWAADPAELFFLHIQGSGRLLYPDGTVVRIGYDNQNGREYIAIGRLLRERGILPAGRHVDAGHHGLDARKPATGAGADAGKSVVHLFQNAEGPRPARGAGASGHSQCDDCRRPEFHPLGAPVWLGMDRPEAWGLWIAQDTGGAIKGANRVDTFWGAGQPMRAGSPVEWPQTARRSCLSRKARRRVRSLGPEEQALWARVAATIRPLSRVAPAPVAPLPRMKRRSGRPPLARPFARLLPARLRPGPPLEQRSIPVGTGGSSRARSSRTG